MKVAGVSTTLFSSFTRPSAISFSASRRLATPARASHLAIRSRRSGDSPASSASSATAGAHEGLEDQRVGRIDGVFRVPLDAEGEAVAGMLDALHHAVGREGVDDGARAGGGNRLVVRAVHRHARPADDAGEQRVLGDGDLVAGLVARVRLLVLARL